MTFCLIYLQFIYCLPIDLHSKAAFNLAKAVARESVCVCLSDASAANTDALLLCLFLWTDHTVIH